MTSLMSALTAGANIRIENAPSSAPTVVLPQVSSGTSLDCIHIRAVMKIDIYSKTFSTVFCDVKSSSRSRNKEIVAGFGKLW